MSRRLLIADRYDAVGLLQIAERPQPDTDILLLGLSNDWCRTNTAAGRRPQVADRLIDPLPFADAAADRVGTFLIDSIAALPEMSLAGTTLRRLAGGVDGGDWWFLPVTEKGPFAGPLVSQLYRLALARAVLDHGEYQQITVELADPTLCSVFGQLPSDGSGPRLDVRPVGPASGPPGWRSHPYVRHWLHALGEVGRLMMIKLFLWSLHLGERAVQHPSAFAGFTFYPTWWSRPFTASAADRFFSHLGETGTGEYLTWLTQPWTLLRRRRQARAVLVARGLTPLQKFLGLADALPLLSPARFSRTCYFERRMRAALRLTFLGFEVGGLLGSEVSRSLTGSAPLINTLIARAVARRAAAPLAETVLYRVEFQPFESAILRGLRGRSRGVGFLHYPFGKHYLSTRLAPSDLARSLQTPRPHDARPLPDGIIACGPLGIRHITAEGYPAARCAACGPQRFGALMAFRRQRPSREAARRALALPLERDIYLVTLAIDVADTEALFGALMQALADPPPYRLIIRTHPNQPGGDHALQAALAMLGPERAVIMDSTADLYQYIIAADAMISIGSMIAFEAMALGCMPINFVNPSSFPALSLAEFAGALFLAHDGAGLQAALQAIRENSVSAAQRRARWPAMLRDVLGDLDTPLAEQLHHAISRLPHPGSGSDGVTAIAPRRERR